MFEGVYCQETNSNTVNETILIDSFNNCIDSALNPSSCADNLPDSKSDEMSTTRKHNSNFRTNNGNVPAPLATCAPGENVRAMYSGDGKLYEAVVQQFFKKPPNANMCRVRYHGYGNEEVRPVNLIFPSLGEAAIKEQIERAKLDEVDDQTDSSDNVQKEINWKKGMACRAKYDKKNIIYEGTVLEVNDSEKTAHVEMLGYGTRYHAKFKDMYESIPDLRQKQASSAHNHMNQMLQGKMVNSVENQQSSEVVSASVNSCVKNNESNDSEKKVDVTSEPLKDPNLEHMNEVKNSESRTSDGIDVKENESNCPDLKTKVDASDVLKSTLESINEEERSSKTVVSYGPVVKENNSNNLNFLTKVDVPSATSKETNVECINEVESSEKLASDEAQLKETKSNDTGFDMRDDVISGTSNEPKRNNSMSELTDVLSENHIPLSLRSEAMLQPKSESEALACLLSANYLNGYYAGYYDCIRRRQNSD